MLTLEAAIAVQGLLLLLAIVLQAGWWYMARAAAHAAAAHGADTARLYRADPDSGVAAALRFARDTASGQLRHPSADTRGSTPTTLAITVRGYAPSFLPGFSVRVSQTVRLPREIYTVPTGALADQSRQATTPRGLAPALHAVCPFFLAAGVVRRSRRDGRSGGHGPHAAGPGPSVSVGRLLAAHGMASTVGSASLELAIVAPGLLLLIGLMVGVGRTQHAHQVVEAAARDAARQASLARTPAQAHTAAQTSALAALAREGLLCTPHVTVDTAGLARPVGTYAVVTAHVSCRVPLSGLMPGLPGHTDVTGQATSPVDPHRGTG